MFNFYIQLVGYP